MSRNSWIVFPFSSPYVWATSTSRKGNPSKTRGQLWRGTSALPVGLERQRDTVHTVPLAGRWRAVGKDVAQVTTAIGAVHFGAGHKERAVGGCGDRVFHRREETR